jgi:hypothetical protein
VINDNLVFLGAAIFFFGSIGYFVDTIKGKVKPNRVTWFIWSLAPLIAFIAQLKQGVGIHQALLTFMVGFIPLIIFIASFVNKKAYWKIGKLDIICGVLSLVGLFLWYSTGTGNVAIFFAILADGLAAFPTVIKSFKFPETENWILYFANAISAGITLLTIKIWNPETFAFPLYIFLLTLLLAVLIKCKIGKLKV